MFPKRLLLWSLIEIFRVIGAVQGELFVCFSFLFYLLKFFKRLIRIYISLFEPPANSNMEISDSKISLFGRYFVRHWQKIFLRPGRQCLWELKVHIPTTSSRKHVQIPCFPFRFKTYQLEGIFKNKLILN